MNKLYALPVTIAISCAASPTWAQDTSASGASSPAGASITTVSPSQMEWKDNPALPKGAKTVVLQGDPTKGPYIMRLKLPPNYKVPPHTHPDERFVTVISGTFYFAEGSTFDANKLSALPQGSVINERKVPHYAATKEQEVILQIAAPTATGIDYINSADDPRKK